MKTGYCKLCRKDNMALHKNSHVFPEFMIRNMNLGAEKKEPPLIFYIGVDQNKKLRLYRTNNKIGEYDQYIFCKDCEIIFRNLDDYGSKLLSNRLKNKLTRQNCIGVKGETYFQFTGIDYINFKLFILSLFLRTSFSERPILQFKLSEEIELALSKMILENKPGSHLEFAVTMVFHRKPCSEKSTHLYFPRTMRPNVHSFFYNDCHVEGVIFTVFTETKGIEKIINDSALMEDGSLAVLILSDDERDKFYSNFLNIPTNEIFLPNKENLITHKTHPNLGAALRKEIMKARKKN